MFSKSIKKRLPAALTIFCLATTTALPQQKKGELSPPVFYTGPVAVQSVTGTIELNREGAPTVHLEVTLYQSSESPKDIRVGFRGTGPVRVSLEPGMTRVLKLSPAMQRSGNSKGAQSVRTDLALEVDGMPVAQPVNAVDVRIVLPQGIPALIRSNMPLERGEVGDRTTYQLVRKRTYLTELVLAYTLGPVTLIIEKSIEPTIIARGTKATITLSVRNMSRVDALNVLLQENFDPRDFSGEGEGFKPYAGKENDRRLLWWRTVERIPAGGSVTVKYAITALAPVQGLSLSAATANIGGELVGVSNKIKLSRSK